MKRRIVLIVLSVLSSYVYCQSGSGTSGDPYYGTIVSSVEWDPVDYTDGKIYIGTSSNNDLTIGTDGHLTVLAGCTLIFTQTTSDLIITGTGRITAAGESGNEITFTKAADKDNRGHISFQSMGSAGASLFDYCIFEYGKVKDLSGSAGFGGGIHLDFSSVTISNSILRYNISEWGGGILINKSRSPIISNCLFLENESDNGGGGIYCWDNTASTISNCIFDSNTAGYGTSATYYTGGGIALQTNTGTQSDQVINCTFVNNDSNHPGDELQLYGGGTKKVTNCIFWGSASPVVGGSSTNLANCAIQGSTTGTNTVNLNSTNSAPDGPHFNATDGSDWSIKVVSPCRDAGTTPSPTVDYDYAGNSRIGLPYDIGAFEVQYNGWKTTAANADWNTAGNWDLGDPSSNQNIVIRSGAANYPTGSTSLDYTIGSGYGLVLEPGAKATFNTLTKTGDLKLMSNSSGTSSLITNNSVSPIVELYLTGGGGTAYKWHYISSPVSALPVSTFAPTPTINFAQYFEARPSTNPLQGWIGYDGYIYSGGGFLTGLPYVISGSNLNVGQGYNYYYASDYKFSFSGNINISSVSPTITYGGNASLHGFNLLGNPFSSGLDWTTIINDAGFPTSTSKGLYFTRNNTQCSFIAGVGYPDASVTGIIPPMQGFFIHTTNTSTTLPLLTGARAHNIPARYKGEEETIPLVRLQLDNDTLMDNTVVRFDTKAEATLDNEFDAVRMFLSESVQYIYSTDGVSKYAINGQPFPETMVQIPLSINVLNSGNHSITATQLQGLESYNIGLKDNITGFTADLKSNPTILFSSDPGIFTGRFVLVISGTTTALPEYPDASEIAFNIYHYQNMLNIQTKGEEWDGSQGSVRVLDLAGRTVTTDANVEFSSNSVIQVGAPAVKGIYVVEISSGVKRYVGKVVVSGNR